MNASTEYSDYQVMKWLPVKQSNPTSDEHEFYLLPKKYEDLSTLCPFPVTKDQFSNALAQLDYGELPAPETIQKIVDFIREKGRMKSVENKLTKICTLGLYYEIPKIDRAKKGFFSSTVQVAKITFPHKAQLPLKVTIFKLETVNKKLKNKWDSKLHGNLRDFMIYYVNQLAIDRKKMKDSIIITDNRLKLASQAQTDAEARKHLFKGVFHKGTVANLLIAAQRANRFF